MKKEGLREKREKSLTADLLSHRASRANREGKSKRKNASSH